MERFPFFPVPLPGEPIHSAISRCASRSGVSATDLLVFLTGARSRTSLLGLLPTCVNELASRLPTNHPWTDSTHTALNHTSLPFLTYFCGPEARSTALHLLTSSDRAVSVYGFLGLSQYPTSEWRRVYLWCADCVAEDVRELGFAIYHREHQLPGVHVCRKHHTVLSCGCKLCGPAPIPGCTLKMPGQCRCKSSATPLPIVKASNECMKQLIWFAEQSAYILSSPWSHSSPRRVLALALDLPEFCRGAEPLYRKIATAIESHYGAECLGLLGYQAFRSAGQPSPWIRGSLRGSRDERRTPTSALLLLLGLSVESVEQFESVDRAEIGKTSRSADLTSNTLDESANPTRPAPPSALAPFKVRFGRNADRSEADRLLADAIRGRGQELRQSSERPMRITSTSLLKHFGQLSKFVLRREKYPATEHALEEASETRHQFLERKIYWGLNRLKLEGRPLSMNLFRRLITTPASSLYGVKDRVAELAAHLGVAVDYRSIFSTSENRGDKSFPPPD